MNIDELTLGQIKSLTALFSNNNCLKSGIDCFVGKKVIVRTYTAGVFFGELSEKSGSEIILKNARRLYYWKTNDKGISLSEVALTGLHSDSKVCAAVNNIWLQAIEIISCTEESIKSIESKNEYKA